jgi:hypothetical protein
MRTVTRLARVLAGIALLSTHAATMRAQDPVTTLPDAYRLQFENEWVKVVRVHYAAGAKLPEHSHPAASIAFVYLTDSEPVVFKHGGSMNRSATRPAVKAGSYRLARGNSEVHSVENASDQTSAFLRVELKTDPAGVRGFRRRVPVQASTSGDSSIEVEFTNAQVRISRLRIPAGKAVDIATTKTEPALLVALAAANLAVSRASNTDLSMSLGQERWIETGQREHVTNTGAGKAEFLLFEFLTEPAR